MVRMQLCAEFVVRACEEAGDDCGFDAYERALIVGAAKILPCYNQYYFDYLASVQEPGRVQQVQRRAEVPMTMKLRP